MPSWISAWVERKNCFIQFELIWILFKILSPDYNDDNQHNVNQHDGLNCDTDQNFFYCFRSRLKIQLAKPISKIAAEAFLNFVFFVTYKWSQKARVFVLSGSLLAYSDVTI